MEKKRILLIVIPLLILIILMVMSSKPKETKNDNKKVSSENNISSSVICSDIGETIVNTSMSIISVNDSVVDAKDETTPVAEVPNTTSSYSVLYLIGMLIIGMGIFGTYRFSKGIKTI